MLPYGKNFNAVCAEIGCWKPYSSTPVSLIYIYIENAGRQERGNALLHKSGDDYNDIFSRRYKLITAERKANNALL